MSFRREWSDIYRPAVEFVGRTFRPGERIRDKGGTDSDPDADSDPDVL